MTKMDECVRVCLSMEDKFTKVSNSHLKKPPLTLHATFLATHKTGITLFACNITNYHEYMLPKSGSTFGCVSLETLNFKLHS